jgi:hypothetical protein
MKNHDAFTGASKLAGSKQKPKGICKDRAIGTRKGTEYSQMGISGRNI